jgi:23S rRNA pseudouridine1911/1915/1917 synthase
MGEIRQQSVSKVEMEKGAGQRIDTFLASILKISRNKIKKKY